MIAAFERRGRFGEPLGEDRQRRRLRLSPRHRRAQMRETGIDRIPNQWCVLRALTAEQETRCVDYRRERTD